MPVHVLHLRAGAERCALASRCVVEVVPAVALRPAPGTLPGLAGLLCYRGRLVPVVDLAQALGGAPAAARLSTRIAVCDAEASEHKVGAWGSQAGGRLVGVRAEDMLEVGLLEPGAVRLVAAHDLLGPEVWAALDRSGALAPPAGPASEGAA